jgi:hypothetical protein
MAKDPYPRLHTVLGEWWRRCNDSTDEGERGEKANRADMARLRRVATFPGPVGPIVDVATALTIGAFRDLYRRAAPSMTGWDRWEEGLAVAAITLAHVRTDAPGRDTAQLLGGADDERRVMAEPRFLRLMRVGTPAELLDEGRRIAALLPAAPVADLGASLMVWLDDPNRRRLWALAYYGLSTPSKTTESSTKPQPVNGVHAS